MTLQWDFTMLESELSFLGILVRSKFKEVSSFILNLNIYGLEVAGKVCRQDCEVENNDANVIEANSCKAEDSDIEQQSKTNATQKNQKQDDTKQVIHAGTSLTDCEAETSDIEEGSQTGTNDDDLKTETCNKQAIWYEGSFEDSEAETYDVRKQGCSTEGGHNGKTKSNDYKKVHRESWFQMWKFIIDNFTISVTFLLLLGLVTGSDATIVEGPENVAIAKDDRAEMRCKSNTSNNENLDWSAVDPQSVKWNICDRDEINPKFIRYCSISKSFPGQSEITIRGAKQTAMTYICVDTGDGSHVQSAELIILESEPQCHAMEHDMKVNCTVSYSGSWKPTITWKDSDGRDVTESALLHHVPNENVTSVLNVSAREWKSYTCEVKFMRGAYSGNATAKNIPKYTRECKVKRDIQEPVTGAHSSRATSTFPAMNLLILLIPCYVWFLG